MQKKSIYNKLRKNTDKILIFYRYRKEKAVITMDSTSPVVTAFRCLDLFIIDTFYRSNLIIQLFLQKHMPYDTEPK